MGVNPYEWRACRVDGSDSSLILDSRAEAERAARNREAEARLNDEADARYVVQYRPRTAPWVTAGVATNEEQRP